VTHVQSSPRHHQDKHQRRRFGEKTSDGGYSSIYVDHRRFFTEAARCVCPGGVVAMIERGHALVAPDYPGVHHEPFNPEASE